MTSDLLSEYLKVEKRLINEAFVRDEAIKTGKQPFEIQKVAWKKMTDEYTAIYDNFERLQEIAEELKLQRIKDQKELLKKAQDQALTEQHFIDTDQRLIQRILMPHLGPQAVGANNPLERQIRLQEPSEEHREQSPEQRNGVRYGDFEELHEMLNQPNQTLHLAQLAELNQAILNGHEEDFEDLENELYEDQFEGNDELSESEDRTFRFPQSNEDSQAQLSQSQGGHVQIQEGLPEMQGNQQNDTESQQTTQSDQNRHELSRFFFDPQQSSDGSLNSSQSQPPTIPRQP